MQQTIKLELTIEQGNVVLAGLGKLPYEVSAPVIQAIHQQASQPQPKVEAENDNT